MKPGGSLAVLRRGLLQREPIGRRVVPILCFSLSMALFSAMGTNAVAQADTPEPGADDDAANSPFNLAPRPLRQLYQEAQKCVPEKRYSEAVRLLGRILDYQETPEDFFFQSKGDILLVRSLKSEAQQLIGEMPADGREAYELEYGARARRMLDQAVQGGGTAGLAAVSRQFFHTKAGYEATYLLGTAEMEQGHPLAAALCLRRLRDTPAAAAEYGPNLLLKLAVCWARAGLTEPAVETLVQLKASFPKAELIVAGHLHKPPDNSAQAIPWLEQTLGARIRPAPAAGAEQWAMYRGSPARNATSLGSSPLLNRRWEIPNANDPHVEKFLGQLRERFLEEGGRVLPGLHPLAVKDFVFMRSVAGLEAVDFRTGKRIWYAPVDKAVEELLDSAGASAPIGGAALPQGTNSLEDWLEQRVWDDAVYGALSSDGEAVYCVEDLDIQPPTVPMGMGAGFRQRQRWIINNGGFQQTVTTRSYNRLAAYEIATEGKLKWSVGGQVGDGQLPLAGSFFLGPPLPLAGKLYVLAETKGEIRLFVLDPKNDGQVEWSQQLAAVPVGVQEDPLRRFAGATPSYADGILVCPTSTGAAVAVDLATRSLLWGFQYPRAVDPMFQNRVLRMQGFAGDESGDNEHWADATVTIAAGRVLLTPIESRHLHCLNLLDGKLLWQVPRDDGLYVGCVHDDQALVVGRHGLRDYHLADGKSNWAVPTLNLPDGSAPSGRGFFDGERYYLPLTTAEVAAVDLAAGRIVARSKSRGGTVPGNLICYQGAVISQGVESLESFHQLEDLRRQVAAVLAQHPDDAEALARQGELLLDEGRLDESVAKLRRSFEVKPEPRTRELLIDALLEGLRLDFAAHRVHLDEIERLAESPSSRAAYLRLLATGLQQSGEVEAALAAYLRLVDLGPPTDALERLDGGLAVRRDRWVRARLAGLREACKPDELPRLDAVLAARLKAAEAAVDPAPLREFLSYFDGHPLAETARTHLAAKLIENGALLEAERWLRESERSSDSGRKRSAVARLAELLARAGRDDDAVCYYRRLAGEWADEVCLEGKTGRQLVEDLPAEGALKQRLAGAWLWPTGQVNKDDHAGNSPNGNRYVPIEVRGRVRPLVSRTSVEYDQNNPSLVGRDGLGHERWRVSLRDRNEIVANGGFPIVSHAREDGHLLLVSTGLQLMAVDTLGAPNQSSPRILWSQDLGDSSNNMAAAGMPMQVRIQMRQMNAWGGLARTANAVGSGPMIAGCVVFQRRRNLTAVDPLTGETLWVRREFPTGCELFGDDELLFVVEPNATEAVVLRAIDGFELGRRQVPRSDERLATLGRMLLVWTEVDAPLAKFNLKLFDPWTQANVWQRPFDSEAQKALVGDEAVGVLEKSGHFVLLSLADGQASIDAQVDPEPLMHEIHLLRGETHDLLIANRPAKQRNVQFATQGMMGTVVINGTIHGFERATGTKVFSTPIDNKLLSLNQPADLPVLLFTSLTQRPGQAGNPTGNLLCIDKRNGRIIFDDNLQTQPGVVGVEVEGDPARREVLVRTPRTSIKLVFTDQPYPDDKPGGNEGASIERDRRTKPDSSPAHSVRHLVNGFDPGAGGPRKATVPAPGKER